MNPEISLPQTEGRGDPPQKSVLKRFWKPLLVIIALACLAPTLMHSAKAVGSLPRPHWPWLAAALGLFLVHYLIQAFGWHLILSSLGQRQATGRSVWMWYQSLIARWMPGRVWYSASRLLLAREAGLSLTAVGFAIVLELIYILVGGVLACLLFAGAALQNVFVGPSGHALLWVTLAVVLTCCALILKPKFLFWMCQFPLFRKCVRRMAGEDLSGENQPTMRTSSSLGLLLYYTVFWLYSGVMFGVLASAFIPMTGARWMACIPTFAGSWLIGFFSIVTPAGIGAREGAMWLMLKPVMPQAEAIVLAVASRVMMVGAELLSVGLMSLVFRGGRTVAPPAVLPAKLAVPENA